MSEQPSSTNSSEATASSPAQASAKRGVKLYAPMMVGLVISLTSAVTLAAFDKPVESKEFMPCAFMPHEAAHAGVVPAADDAHSQPMLLEASNASDGSSQVVVLPPLKPHGGRWL